MPPQVWDYLKSKGFFAMIIPKKYGGLEFSAYAHSCVLVKLASRSGLLAATTAVPNSLGPAELLNHYGTEEQKNHYLPRLARGEEVPCFALTGPRAGSDAASLPDTGIVCRGMYQGREIVGLKLNFSKRYITLAPIATVVGLAFRLFDPDKLLGGDKVDLGITCALIPRNTPGLTIGRRHFPLNVPFQNGPLSGKDVFVPLDFIIGGPEMAGQGWRMLVEQLSVGRCISLPSNATGGAKLGVFASGAYARIRRQFNMPVGKFEGVEAVHRAHGGLHLHDGRGAFGHRRRDRWRRKAVGAFGHAQVPRHRDGPPGRERRDGRARRQGHPARARATISAATTRSCRSPSPSKARTSSRARSSSSARARFAAIRSC